MGPYVVDFVCHTARLVVEVDGGQHGRDEVIVRDQLRTEWFEQEGYNVIRFWNNDVMKNMDGVMQIIAQHLAYSTD